MVQPSPIRARAVARVASKRGSAVEPHMCTGVARQIPSSFSRGLGTGVSRPRAKSPETAASMPKDSRRIA